jgi:hypothetical protein
LTELAFPDPGNRIQVTAQHGPVRRHAVIAQLRGFAAVEHDHVLLQQPVPGRVLESERLRAAQREGEQAQPRIHA